MQFVFSLQRSKCTTYVEEQEQLKADFHQAVKEGEKEEEKEEEEEEGSSLLTLRKKSKEEMLVTVCDVSVWGEIIWILLGLKKVEVSWFVMHIN